MSQFPYRFGPQWTPDGVIFRLWAPAVTALHVEVGGTAHPMLPVGEGWYHSPPIPTPPGVTYGFRVNDDLLVPDPASRQQAEDVHGASVLRPPVGVLAAPASGADNRIPATAPPADRTRANRDWTESVVYELHIGTFSPTGNFAGVIPELPRLRDLGITVVELMPVADFPGRWNWGYDGVLPFAADRTYGTPDDLRSLIDAAHDHGLAIWLDVVYNHFGPEGNYLHLYAPQFFSDKIDTPWGPGIDFERPEVRRFFIENAVYWTAEIGFDGLRLDAVHAIRDNSVRIVGSSDSGDRITGDGGTHVLNELAQTVRSYAPAGTQVHLVLENDRNEAHFLSPLLPGRAEAPPAPDHYDGQWNDDIHHAFHVLLTGETAGYYGDYADNPERLLLRALTTGYVYQGEVSPGTGKPRGEPSGHLSPTRFLSFLQNHDQIGNRAWGERLKTLTDPAALRAAIVLQILTPQIPLVFMGEEVGTEQPFQFFCDFGPDLAEAVRAGRRREFGLADIPDPIAPETVAQSGLPRHIDNEWTGLYRELIAIRQQELVPLLPRISAGIVISSGTEQPVPEVEFGNGAELAPAPVVRWRSGNTVWCVAFNLSDTPRPRPVSLNVGTEERHSPPKAMPVYPKTLPDHGEVPPRTTWVWKEVE